MKIRFHKTFKKEYSRLTLKQKERVNNTLVIFQDNPHNPLLYNHPLKGDQKGRRSISAGGDLRVIFREKDNYLEILFLHVGTHNQLY